MAEAATASGIGSDGLDPSFFSDPDHLNPEVRRALLAVADDALSGSGGLRSLGIEAPVTQVLLTGSETGPDYDDQSDLDLHVVVDLARSGDPGLLKTLLDLFAKSYNERKYSVLGRTVEIYFQAADDKLVSPGTYDLRADSWIQRPDDVSRHAPTAQARLMAQAQAAKVAGLEAALSSGRATAADVLRAAERVSSDLREMRRRGLESGLQGDGNVAFKLLRRDGTLGRLSSLKDAARKATLGVS